jgi:hypothetical protein
MQFSTTLRNACLDVIETTVGTAAKLNVYTGTGPGVANAATGTLLVSLTLPSDWMASATGGTKSLTGTWQNSSASANGVPGYFRILDSTGTTVYVEGTAAVGSGELNFAANIAQAFSVTVTSFTLTGGNP